MRRLPVILSTALLLGISTAAGLFVGGSALGKSPKASDPFKGKWDVTLHTGQFGDIPVHVSLTPNMKGVVTLGDAGRLPVVHQETDTWISWTIELPAVQAPDSNAHTLIGRGTLNGDGTMSGNLIIVTSTLDDTNPTGYQTLAGTFDATKRGAK